jgi:hypothetical protein
MKKVNEQQVQSCKRCKTKVNRTRRFFLPWTYPSLSWRTSNFCAYRISSITFTKLAVTFLAWRCWAISSLSSAYTFTQRVSSAIIFVWRGKASTLQLMDWSSRFFILCAQTYLIGATRAAISFVLTLSSCSLGCIGCIWKAFPQSTKPAITRRCDASLLGSYSIGHFTVHSFSFVYERPSPYNVSSLNDFAVTGEPTRSSPTMWCHVFWGFLGKATYTGRKQNRCQHRRWSLQVSLAFLDPMFWYFLDLGRRTEVFFCDHVFVFWLCSK